MVWRQSPSTRLTYLDVGVPAEKLEELFEAPQAALAALEAEGAELVVGTLQPLLKVLYEEEELDKG